MNSYSIIISKLKIQPDIEKKTFSVLPWMKNLYQPKEKRAFGQISQSRLSTK